MPSTATLWGIASITLATIQYIPYLRSIFGGHSRPHAFTWLVWGLQAVIVFFAQLAKSAGAGTWTTGYTALFCTVIFTLALSRGEKKIVWLDWVTLSCAVLAIVLWIVTKDPLLAVIFTTIAGVLGWVPTVRKSIDKPYEESFASFSIAMVKWFCATMAVESASVTTVLYPATCVITTLMFLSLLVVRRNKLKVAA